MFKRITTTDGQLRRLDDVATSTTIKKKRKLFGGKIFLKENLIRLPHLCARPSFLTSTLAVFYYLFSNISTYLARHFETTIVATSKQHKKSSDAEKIAWDFLLMVICFFLSVFGRKSASTSSTSSSSYFFFYKEKVPIVLYFFFPLLFEFMALFVFQSTVPLCTFYSHWNDELLAEDLGRVTDAGHTVRRQHVVRQSFSLCILLTANDWCVCVQREKKNEMPPLRQSMVDIVTCWHATIFDHGSLQSLLFSTGPSHVWSKTNKRISPAALTQRLPA